MDLKWKERIYGLLGKKESIWFGVDRKVVV